MLFLIREVWDRPSVENFGKVLVSIFFLPIVDLPGNYPHFFLMFYFFVLAGLAVSIVYLPDTITWILSVCSVYFTLGTSTALTIINSGQGAN